MSGQRAFFTGVPFFQEQLCLNQGQSPDDNEELDQEDFFEHEEVDIDVDSPHVPEIGWNSRGPGIHGMEHFLGLEKGPHFFGLISAAFLHPQVK